MVPHETPKCNKVHWLLGPPKPKLSAPAKPNPTQGLRWCHQLGYRFVPHSSTIAVPPTALPGHSLPGSGKQAREPEYATPCRDWHSAREVRAAFIAGTPRTSH